jgi:hypothetical protein
VSPSHSFLDDGAGQPFLEEAVPIELHADGILQMHAPAEEYFGGS